MSIGYAPATMAMRCGRRTHQALAVDENGGITGPVTLAAILEEMTVSIEDEYGSLAPEPPGKVK